MNYIKTISNIETLLYSAKNEQFFVCLIEVQMVYNVISVSGVQHRDLTIIYITQCSPW